MSRRIIKLLCLALAFWAEIGFSLTIGIDWLKSLSPKVVLRDEQGELRAYKVIKWTRTKKVKTKAGWGEEFLAELEKRKDVKLKAVSLSSQPALIVWLELKDGFKNYLPQSSEQVCVGLEINLPQNLPKKLSFKISAFAPPVNEIVPTNGPVVFYNRNFQTLIISPLDHFLYSLIREEKSRLQIGLEAELDALPKGFSHPVIFYSGRGIRQSFEEWGRLLRRWYGTTPPDLYADVGLKYLGYWTDNGSFYYYNTEKGMNYEETLLALKKYADELGVPFGYFQIDSWWYLKSTDKRTGFGPLDWIKNLTGGGVIRWEARKDVFPQGVKAFQQKLGLPLIAHNRWYDKSTDYRKEYKFVDGVGNRNPAFPIEERFWDMILKSAKERGIVVYEQDWLDTQWKIIPYIRQHIDVGENWLSWMSKYAQKYNLTIQYCMANPGIFLQAVKYPNITQIRCSGDYLAGAPKEYWWKHFFITSMLAWSCGIYPWKDTYLSSSGQRLIRDEKRSFEETLISVLSAGPVGPGDRIGYINKPLLMRTCRKDGVLLKPDKPAMPIDKVFISKKGPFTVITETATQIGKYYYVAGFNLYPYILSKKITFADLSIKNKNYLVWDWKNKRFQKNPQEILLPKRLGIYKAVYYILVPELEKGVAFIGEFEKFITTSKGRFQSIEYNNGVLKLTLKGVQGEQIKLGLKTSSTPKIQKIKGAKTSSLRFSEPMDIYVLSLQFNLEQAEVEIKL